MTITFLKSLLPADSDLPPASFPSTPFLSSISSISPRSPLLVPPPMPAKVLLHKLP